MEWTSRWYIIAGWLSLTISSTGTVNSSTCGLNCLNSPGLPSESPCDMTSGECLFGCVWGYTGNSCLIPCGENCVKCSFASNTSTGSETICLQCNPGYYLISSHCKPCSSKCLINTNSEIPICDRLTGFCNHGCNDTFYGSMCNKECGIKCMRQLCERDGVCSVGCRYPNLGGPRCDQDCSKGCYGVDSLCNQQMVCVYGCKMNYWGPTCRPCSDGCAESASLYTDATCNEDSGSCKFGCKTNKYGIRCLTTCPEHCTGGLCKQTTGECINKCIRGYFGPFCNNSCSQNCPDNDCYPENGTCVAETCLVTEQAWYGPSCDRRCSRNCKNKVCHKSSGTCFEGCEAGYFGEQCDTVCLQGTYGETCARNCSRGCVNMTCTADEGRCLCVEPYLGANCDFKGTSKRLAGMENSSSGTILALGVPGGFILITIIAGVIIYLCMKHKFESDGSSDKYGIQSLSESMETTNETSFNNPQPVSGGGTDVHEYELPTMGMASNCYDNLYQDLQRPKDADEHLYDESVQKNLDNTMDLYQNLVLCVEKK